MVCSHSAQINFRLFERTFCDSKEEALFTLRGKSLKLLYQFPYLGSNISSIETDISKSIWPLIEISSLS